MLNNLIDLLQNVAETAYRALCEDMGDGDLTADLLPHDLSAKAILVAREPAILCGIPWFNSVFKQLHVNIDIEWQKMDGDEIAAKQDLCVLTGPVRALLTGERAAMNFVQMLSGTATITREYVRILQGTETQLLDTRKTIPGLREAQKYAVRCGGGYNHRLGLFDRVLIKENHIAVTGSITKVIEQAQRLYPDRSVELEVETLAELQEAIDAGVRHIMLDNFSLANMCKAVSINNGQAKLEASGGCDKNNLRAIAETGVNYISVGALTKHIKAVDMSMRFV